VRGLEGLVRERGRKKKGRWEVWGGKGKKKWGKKRGGEERRMGNLFLVARWRAVCSCGRVAASTAKTSQQWPMLGPMPANVLRPGGLSTAKQIRAIDEEARPGPQKVAA